MSPSTPKPYAALGARLKALREKKNLALPALAEASGVGERTLSDYEAGLRMPGGRNLAKLAIFFKTTAAALLR
jgi:transcriptional regulator with XRE-family HTH domain